MSKAQFTKLSEAEIEELKQAFAAFDKDGSGSITVDELRLMLTTLSPLEEFSEADARRIVARFDLDGDGQINFDEFLTMMTKAENRSSNVDELHEAFKVFDRDNDGVITSKEIMDVMKKLGEDVDLTTCELMVRSVDLDGNRSIDVYEFRKMMRDGFNINAKIN